MFLVLIREVGISVLLIVRDIYIYANAQTRTSRESY